MKKDIAIALIGIFPLFAYGQSTDPLNDFLTQTRQASGSFDQQTYQKDGKPAEAPQKGNFVFSRPGKFVWNYSAPYEQQMVCDGNKIYIWDKDLNQVTVRRVKGAIPQSPASVLFGMDSYTKDWHAAKPQIKDGITWVSLTPKKKEVAIQSVSFGFKDGSLERMTYQGSMGEKTELHFNGIQTGINPDPSVFKFSIPKGADVVEVK